MTKIAVILARGNSKGIKNKNIKTINNKPLIYWSINTCLKSKNIDTVWVSSDSKKILSLSKKFGANIIKRPKNISGDYSKSEKAWEHAISFIKKNFSNVETVIGVQPTSPIRSYKTLDKAINMFYKKKLDSLFTAEKVYNYFIWKKQGKKYIANYNYSNRPMRQEIEKKYLENGSFYIFNAEKFLKEKCRLFGKIGCFTMGKVESFEIDNHEDLKLFNSLGKFFK